MIITLLIALLCFFIIIKLRKEKAKKKAFEALRLNLKKGYKVTIGKDVYTFVDYHNNKMIARISTDKGQLLYIPTKYIDAVQKCAAKPIVIDDVQKFFEDSFQKGIKDLPRKGKTEHYQYKREKEKQKKNNRVRNKIARKSRQINRK